MPEEKKTLPKRKIILISVVAVILVVAVIAVSSYLSWYNSPEQQALRFATVEDFSALQEVVDTDDAVRDSATLADTLVRHLEELKRSYLEETIEYAAACAEIENVRKLNVTGVLETLNEVESFVEVLNASRTCFATGESFFGNEHYAEAITQYQQVIEDDPNYSTAQTRIDSCITKYRENALSEAAALTADGSYAEAISLLESALSVLPNDSKIKEQIILYEADLSAKSKSDALASAKTYADAGDYANAIRAVSALLASTPNDYQLTNAYNDYCSAYENQVITAADTLAAERKYSEAIEQIKSAQKLLPDSQILKDKIAALEASKPVSLAELGAINGGWTWNDGTPVDPFGNDYSGTSFSIHSNHRDWNTDSKTVSAEYRLYGKYNLLTFTLAPYTSISEHGSWYVQVYTDDGTNNYVLVYTSPEITRKTDAATYEAVITGAEYVKICIVLGDEAAAIVADVQAWPN